MKQNISCYHPNLAWSQTIPLSKCFEWLLTDHCKLAHSPEVHWHLHPLPSMFRFAYILWLIWMQWPLLASHVVKCSFFGDLYECNGHCLPTSWSSAHFLKQEIWHDFYGSPLHVECCGHWNKHWVYHEKKHCLHCSYDAATFSRLPIPLSFFQQKPHHFTQSIVAISASTLLFHTKHTFHTVHMMQPLEQATHFSIISNRLLVHIFIPI